MARNKRITELHMPRSFTLKGGLIYTKENSSTCDPESEWYFFDAGKGDDWFYMEDQTTSSQRAKGDSQPFAVSTVSGKETTLIRFKNDRTPEHTVLDEGWCKFTGLKPVVEGKKGQRSRAYLSDRSGTVVHGTIVARILGLWCIRPGSLHRCRT